MIWRKPSDVVNTKESLWLTLSHEQKKGTERVGDYNFVELYIGSKNILIIQLYVRRSDLPNQCELANWQSFYDLSTLKNGVICF